jgi:hypothetical protein
MLARYPARAAALQPVACAGHAPALAFAAPPGLAGDAEPAQDGGRSGSATKEKVSGGPGWRDLAPARHWLAGRSAILAGARDGAGEGSYGTSADELCAANGLLLLRESVVTLRCRRSLLLSIALNQLR